MELLIAGPEGSSRTVTLRNESMSLGRSPENAMAYPQDPWLSRFHLCFERRDGEWFVRDCGSRNGTIVNANNLKGPHRMTPGDRIYAGHLTIEVRSASTETSSRVISFVPHDEAQSPREATIVTSLDQVLSKASAQERGNRESTLSTARVVRALIHAGQELAGLHPLEEVFTVILDLSLGAMGAKRGVILTLEDGELIVRASRGEGFSLSTSVRDRVLKEKKSQMISDVQDDAGLREQKSIIAQRIRSIMAVPLQTGDRVIGLIYVDNGAFVRPFSQEDLDLLTVMANVAAIRIEHARLASVEQSEKLMESELSQAGEIQRTLLPAEAPVCKGYELAGLNLPCRTIGGDYYDFLPYKDGRLGLVVGDVSGKGMPAALMMSSLQARVQMLLETSPEPDAAVTVLNRNLAERCPLGKFITFFYALLDPPTGTVRYSNAGHNYPLLVRADGCTEQLSHASGMVMGLFASHRYQSQEISLQPGDLLALFSDGVTEARSPEAAEEFGEEGLAKFLVSKRTEPCSRIVSDLVEHVRAWGGQATFADDFTVLLVRRTEGN